MQDMRYLNLFSKVTRVSTIICFKYNNNLVFCVPQNLISRAIGQNGKNVKEIYAIIGKRVKIIPMPYGIQDAKSFIENIVSPVTFKDIQINENEIIVDAGSQSKAALIGRNKRRLLEMQKIVKDFFGREFKII